MAPVTGSDSPARKDTATIVGEMIIASRIIFLGILFSGPIYNSEGKIAIKEIPTRQEVINLTP